LGPLGFLGLLFGVGEFLEFVEIDNVSLRVFVGSGGRIYRIDPVFIFIEKEFAKGLGVTGVSQSSGSFEEVYFNGESLFDSNVRRAVMIEHGAEFEISEEFICFIY
jgi:hypothetical protein